MKNKNKYWRGIVNLIGIALVGSGISIANATSPVSTSFDLVFPSGYALSRVTVAAAGDLVLGAGDQILASDGSPGSVTNSGSGLLSVGPETSTGDIASAGNIQLGPNVFATSARSSGMVTLSPGDKVGAIQQGATMTPFVRRAMVVLLPGGLPGDCTIQRGSSIRVAPGRWGKVTVEPGAVGIFSAGTYLVDDLDIEPQASLQLDTSGGTVNIYVNNSAVWKGASSGDASRFIFGFLGQGSLSLDTAFRGTVLVPFGTLDLKLSSGTYQGTFYAKHLVVGPNITIQELPTPLLVDGLTVSNSTPCIGEMTEVSLEMEATTSKNATAWIQGVVGGHQFVQFGGRPGPRLIWASVYTPGGHSDSTSVPVTAQQCAAQIGSPPLALHFWGALKKPNVVEFVVHNYDANGSEISTPGAASYTWSFGDGQTATTSSPFTSHDYTVAINPMAQYNYFDVSVMSGGATAKKVVPIWSLYAKNRAKGIVQPPSSLSLSSSNLALAVTNYEQSPLSITQANVELIPCDPSLDSRPQTPQALTMTVAAVATATVNVTPPASIASDVCSIAVHLMGTTAAGRVYSDAYRTLKENPQLVQAITDASTIALLNQASALTADPNHFDEFELREPYAAGLIAQLPPPDPPSTASPKTADPTVGQSCTPGDTDTSIQYLVCSPTTGWVFVGPEVLNAFKGNFIMDHGCGNIGQLLSSVGQLYSHTSTIVKNRVEVRHSTASGDRIDSSVNLNPVVLKLDSEKLKYAFPGTAGPNQTYTIDQMVNAYFLTDPDDPSQTWGFGGELNPNPSQCTGDTTATLPLVVRPAPDAPANVLQGVASVADHTNINSHYRFFNYTRADELLPGSGWANGTVSTVCSSFDRLAAVDAGLPLHPTLSTPGVPDGMREYSIGERTTGGHTLYAGTYNKVIGRCSFDFFGLCETLADNVANQLNNCFAFDGCNDTNPDWVNPGTGVAVSPDDMLDWDTWQKGGTYGYNEPFVYQPKGYRHAYAWAASPGSGSMTVKVVDINNNPFPMATILINTNAVGTTDSTGTFQISALPAGNYDVGAQFDPCAAPGHPNNCMLPLEQANIMVTLPPNGSITVSLVLCAGPGGSNCPQPGTGPTLNVGITETQTGPDVCFTGSGYTASAPVQVTYASIPGINGNPSTNVSSDAKGNINAIDTRWDFGGLTNFCTQDQLDGTAQVTITALDKVSNLAVQSLVPAAYWCGQSLVSTNFNGGCHQ